MLKRFLLFVIFRLVLIVLSYFDLFKAEVAVRSMFDSFSDVFLSLPPADDVIFLRQGLGRGAKQPFPSLGTFISTLSQRRDAGGRGLTGGMMGTLTSNQWLRHGE